MTYRPPLSTLLLSFFTVAALVTTGCHKNNPGIPATLSVSPAIDTIGGTVTITGSGFNTDPAKDIVSFNDTVVATVLSATATTLTIQVPYYTARDRITVKNKDNGQAWQTIQIFTVAPKFYPQTVAPGYPINIIAGGGILASDYSVKFGSAQGQITGLIDAFMTVTVPEGATSGPITVLYKGQPVNSLTNFTVAPVGQVTTLVSGFTTPLGMAFDKNGNLFVSDLQGGVIKKITPDGTASIFAGDGTFNGSDGPLSTAGVYGANSLVFTANGDLYFTVPWYSYIRRIHSDSITTFTTAAGPHNSTVLSPTGICMNASGDLIVSDNTYMQIKKVTLDGTVTILAGQGTQGVANGPAASATFSGPTSLALDPTGNLYIADGDAIRMLSGGTVSTFAGSYNDFKDGVGAIACFNQPASIVRDGSGNIYVADRGNQVIRMITPAGVVTTIAGKPKQKGKQDGTGANALFNDPSGIAIDKNGVIYVSDYSNGIIRKIVLH